MKEFRPQVFFGMLVLGALAYYAMSVGFNEGALGFGAGVIYAVKVLSTNGVPKTP